MYSGVTGIISKPIQGYQSGRSAKENIKEVGKGLYKGVLGAVTTPITGVLRAG